MMAVLLFVGKKAHKITSSSALPEPQIQTGFRYSDENNSAGTSF
jgi:hypothetical protein